jgi:hypothetical protein
MEPVLEPACYKRHSEIENHIKEGRFWRGVIITAALTGITILIAQYSMAIENNNKMIALTSKLTTMVDLNTLRLSKIEDRVWTYDKSK